MNLVYNERKLKTKGKDMHRMRIMGVDYGDARTGIAISDLLCSIVGTTTVIHSRNREKTLAAIDELVKKNDVGQIVMGLPKNMDGTEGIQATKAREFAAALGEMTGLEVVMWDERLTSVTANQLLTQTGVKGQKRKQHVDKIAAVIILQNYLDAKGFGL